MTKNASQAAEAIEYTLRQVGTRQLLDLWEHAKGKTVEAAEGSERRECCEIVEAAIYQEIKRRGSMKGGK